MIPKDNPTSRDNQPNPLKNVPDDPDLDPSFSDSFFWIHLTHQTTRIINDGDVKKRIKMNAGVKRVSTDLSKSAQNLQPSYQQTRTNKRS